MSWLAKMHIDHEVAASMRIDLSDGYAWHQIAWQVFPGLDDQTRSFLWRLDSGTDGYKLLLLSKQHQPHRPNWCEEDCWAVKTISPEFLKLRHYRFDLRANPTKCVPKIGANGQPAKNGRRKPLTKLDEQNAWLQRKAADAGFKLIDAPDVGFCQDQVFRKHSGRGVHTAVRFKGILEVTDPSLFEAAFYQGIGSAKGFGFGMLLLQPICL